MAGTNHVLIDPELAEGFPTQEAVNEALRKLVEVAEARTRLAARVGRNESIQRSDNKEFY
ncbi:MAG TPA: hypothetical protein VMV46_16595 [Thermoanaerobaculia bacterium]|nr:hypothetical protein [Thermoanaerobaculia bacterium]